MFCYCGLPSHLAASMYFHCMYPRLENTPISIWTCAILIVHVVETKFRSAFETFKGDNGKQP